MSFMERLMRRFHWVPNETRDEIINSSIEENAQAHSDLVGALHEALQKRSASNEALRNSIVIAKQRTSSFADFERMAIRREEMK